MRLNTRSKWLFLKGMAMGAADLVPGISGGTIALITGIYEELLNSLKSINLAAVKTLFSAGLPAGYRYINGHFLLPLACGILFSIFCFSSLIHYLLNTFPVPLWSFFFGLIVISFYSLVKKTPQTNVGFFVTLITGTAIAWFITDATPIMIENPSLVTLFGAGALAICAMILPGLSGSFILLLLGLYTPILQAVIHLNFTIIVIFSLGCLCGLLCFSHLLNWLLTRYHSLMLGLLSGLMLGSLNKVWPWKQAAITHTGQLVQSNISPWNYASTTSILHLCIASACMLMGVACIIFLEKKFKPKSKKI